MRKNLLCIAIALSLFACQSGKSKESYSEGPDTSKAVVDGPQSGKSQVISPTAFLTDFETTGNNLMKPYTGYIYGFTDILNGGKSNIIELVKNKKGESVLNPITQEECGALKSNSFLKISGSVTTDFEYGYAGCGLNFDSKSLAIDISKFKGIRFYAKGHGANYFVKLECSLISDNAYHETTFFAGKEWKKIEILFSNLEQPNRATDTISIANALKNAKGIQWQTSTQPIKPYELYLDNIELIEY
jgi:hypothetical protein